MVKLISRAAPILVCLVFMAFMVTSAQATSIDYACGSGTCTGTVTVTGTNAAGSGIGVVEGGTPAPSPNQGATFTLSFNTANAGMLNSIDLVGTGSAAGTDLDGIIESFMVTVGGSTTDVDFLNAFWPSLPTAYVGYLGTTGGTDSGFTISLNSTGAVTSADVTITPTPEPASMLLFGLGMLAFGIYLKRRPHSNATA